MKTILLAFLLILFTGHAMAHVVIDGTSDNVAIAPNVSELIDEQGTMDIASVIRSHASGQFRPLSRNFFNHGYHPRCVWMAFTAEVPPVTGREYYFPIAIPTLDRVEWYAVSGSTVFQSFVTGDSFSFSQRPVRHRDFIFPLLAREGPVTYFIKIKSTSRTMFTPVIQERRSFERDDSYWTTVFWMILAVMCVMAFYNLFIFISIRESLYLYYGALNVFYVVHLLSVFGYLFQYAFPETPFLAKVVPSTSAFIVVVLMILFSTRLLEIRSVHRALYWLACSPVVIGLLGLPFFLLFEKTWIMTAVTFMIIALSFPLFFGIAAWKSVAKKDRMAVFYMASWVGIVAAMVVSVLNYHGITAVGVGNNRWHVMFGETLQVVVLAFGLADRLQRLRLELVDLNTGLERKVTERTHELNAALDELSSVNSFLLKTNRQLETAHQVMQLDMSMAVNVQNKYLPREAPASEEYEISYYFLPMAGVSGDFYDFYEIDGTLRGLGLYDVSGHGVSSGLITMIARSLLYRSFVHGMRTELNRVIEHANRSIIREIGAVDIFITGIMLRFSGDTVEYVNAGHPDLILKKGDVTDTEGDESSIRGFFLGVDFMENPYAVKKFRMTPGDSILLFTDGLMEQENGQRDRYGIERIADSFRAAPEDCSAEKVVERLLADFFSFAGRNDSFSDDITLMVIRKT